MKRFIKKLLIFAVIVIIVDILYGLICGYMVKYPHSGETARTAGIFLDNRYDVMLMGSSRCVCHYDDLLMSDSLGLDVVNAGEKGNGIVLMYGRYLLIPQENKPKVLIYDIEPSFDALVYEKDDNNKRYLAGLKHYYNRPGIKEIFMKVDSVEPIKMMSNLYRYNSDLMAITKDYLRKGEIELSCYNPSYKQYVATTESSITIKRSFDQLKLYYLEELMKKTKQDGVQMIVVASPKFSATSLDDLQPVIDLSLKYNIPFWDYYLSMHDTKWFCNNMHLNYEGSQEFTNTIIQRIKNEQQINVNLER